MNVSRDPLGLLGPLGPRRGHIGFYPNRDGRAQRYWVHDRVLVGGSIMSAEDAEALRHMGVTHVLSAEDQQDDAGKWPDDRRARHEFVDGGQDVPLELVHAMVGYTRRVLQGFPDAVLYAHCHMGGSRGPTLGYIALRAAFEFTPAQAMAAIRVHRGDWTPHLRYIHSVERALASKDEQVDEVLAWVRVVDAYRETPAPQQVRNDAALHQIESVRRMLAEACVLLEAIETGGDRREWALDDRGQKLKVWLMEYRSFLGQAALANVRHS